MLSIIVLEDDALQRHRVGRLLDEAVEEDVYKRQAYALLFSAAYFFWAINKINMKTLLTFTVIIYFFPVFGYLSNPCLLYTSDY